MKDILETIIAAKRLEVDRRRAILPPAEFYPQVERSMDAGNILPSMSAALLASSTGIIAEFKRKSPSKGWIRQEARAEEIPLGYQQGGAAALSILSDEAFFGGSDEDIRTARRSGVSLPVLYKNFVIDEYQLYQARHCGASAVLLIAAALSLQDCRQLRDKARQLGLEVLLEMHDEKELDYCRTEPEMYGTNNRHLGTFITDVQTSISLIDRLPAEGCKVSESGLSDAGTVLKLRQAGYRGFLMGEYFMRSERPGQRLQEFIRHCTTDPIRNA